MLDEIKRKIESVNAQNGYAVFPRRVVVIEEAGERHQQSERTVAILKDDTGVGVMLGMTEGPTRDSLKRSITEVLKDQYTVQKAAFGMIVQPKNTPDTD